MFDLEFIIVTFNRPKYLKETLESFIKINRNFETRLIILDGGHDYYLEEINGIKINTSQIYKNFVEDNKCKKIIEYKKYNNNGNWHEIISDYVNNLSNANYFAIIGDDDIFLNFSGFEKAINLSKENFKKENIGIINLFYQDNTRENVIPIVDEIIDGLTT